MREFNRDLLVPGANLTMADLAGENLAGADLNSAVMRRADLQHADLQHASLRGAILSGAFLHGADLRGADLQGAVLRDADMRYADLRDADLRDADLQGVDLRGADLRGAKNVPTYVAAMTSILPDGDIVGWKKLENGLLCKLMIPADARRTNATGRQCRTERAKVLEIWDNDQQVKSGRSRYCPDFVYTVGEWVSVENFDEDHWATFTTGIHFFSTRWEAVTSA